MTPIEWVERLKPWVDKDLITRQVLVEKGILNDTYHPEMEKVHLENAAKLSKLIEKEGFPVLSNAGSEGVRLSWLIIHHSISLPAFMRESIIQMRLAAAQQDYILELLAYTEDRIAYFEGRPQLYGTNFDWEDGVLGPTPIADPEHLDVRRKSMGLPPLSTGLPLASHERPPKDPEGKLREFNQWLKRVGWRV